MSASLRWSLVAFVVLIGVVVALLSTLGGPEEGAGSTAAPATAPPVGAPPAEEPRTIVDAETRGTVDLPE